MKKCVFVVFLLTVLVSCRQGTAQAPPLRTALDTVSYAIGQDMARYILATEKKLDTGILDRDILFKSMEEALSGESSLTESQMENAVSNYFNKVLPEKAQKSSEAFLNRVEKSDKNIVKTESGLLYKIEKEGGQRHPAPGNTVYLMYEGRKHDGSLVESTYNDYQGEESFPFDRMMPGWQEGLSKIGEGGIIKLWIPSHLAYGSAGNEQVGPNQALYYYIEMVAVI